MGNDFTIKGLLLVLFFWSRVNPAEIPLDKESLKTNKF